MKALAALTAAAALVLVAAAPASAAQMRSVEVDEAAKGMRAVTGAMLTAPQPYALRKQLPVRVSLRVPKGTTKLTVRVGGKDLSKRFRGRGRVRTARLDRGDGLRYGTNTVFVLAQRGKKRPLAHARTFYVLRRAPGLIGLDLGPAGPVTAVTLKVRKPAVLTAAHLQKPGAVARQLSAMQRHRTVRLWLNGKRVTRAIGSSRPTRWTAQLSATQGLRYGVNRLRAYVVEPGTGRFQTLRRSFVVKPNRPLPAAGWDKYSRAGSHLRLDGRRSRAAGDVQRSLRWTIVSKPVGSKATLRRANSARPRLSPDRPGKYVVRLTVSARGRSSSDRVQITAAPEQLLQPFTGYNPELAQGKGPGIEVGGVAYEKPKDGAFQWLTLDRSSLTPGEGAKSNNWFDKGASGEHSLEGVYNALKGMGHDQLVVLAMPLNSASPVEPSQVAQFNNILNLLGADSLAESELTAGDQQLVVVGVPYAHPGSAWVSRVEGASKRVFGGWTMPDIEPSTNGDLNFRFQPERIEFDTEQSSTATTNTMEVAGQAITGSLPEGSSGGFHVVVFDPETFAPLANLVFSTNSNGVGGSPLSGRRAMAKYLREEIGSRQLHVAVQSIGTVGNFTNSPEEQFQKDMNAAWWDLSRALAVYGANPDTFNRVNRSYAFLGGPRLARDEVADSSSAVAIDPTGTPLYESGTLHGRAAQNSEGIFEPAIASSVETPDLELYDKVFTKPTAWPLTRGAGLSEREAKRYAEALTYISNELGAGPNIRSTYWQALERPYSIEILKMQKIGYPGSGKTCSGRKATAPAGLGSGQHPTYTREQFCRMVAQLEIEFGLLEKVKGMFDAYEEVFARGGQAQKAELDTIGKNIEEAIKPDNAEEIAWAVGGFLGELIEAGLELVPGGEEAVAAWEAVVAVYELTRDLLGETGGAPVSEEVESKVGELGTDLLKKMEDSSGGVERLRQVIISDWGRLKAVGSVAGTPGWIVNKGVAITNLKTSGGSFFGSELMPMVYGVHDLEGTGFNADPTTENCYTLNFGHTYRGAPESGKLEWMGDFNFQERTGGFPSRFVLAVPSPSALRYSYAPASVTDTIFHPVVQGGYGVHLPQYVWESYEDKQNPPGPSPPTYIAYCH